MGNTELVGVEFGYSIALHLSGGYQVRIEEDAHLHSAGGEHTRIPAGTDHSEELAALVGRLVVSCTADDVGALTIVFDTGARLRVDANKKYESWNVTGPNGMRVISEPGGELAVWPADSDF